MDLFKPIVPIQLQHQNFVNALSPGRYPERAVVSAWVDGFPDRDGKFIKEFQTTFNSSFWEVYLYGLFKSYQFELNWAHATPDFHLCTPHGEIIIEAVSANSANGKDPEWVKSDFIPQAVQEKKFWTLNKEAVIRLSNALVSKARKYDENYKKLAHVAGKPFVIAVAPFEQPGFQHQYDRPMRALLYDEYIDEEIYLQNPESFPFGPPTRKLGEIEKDNGSSLSLGIFHDELWSDVSAVIFSCVATWGKAVAMSTEIRNGFVHSVWSTDASGKSAMRTTQVGFPGEEIHDGLQIFHNPKAKRPLDPRIFRRKGVVQHYMLNNNKWVQEEYDRCLQIRFTFVTSELQRHHTLLTNQTNKT